MGQNRYCYIRATFGMTKYRSFGFNTIREFDKYLEGSQYGLKRPRDYFPLYYFDNALPSERITIQFWRADTKSGKHYLLGGLHSTAFPIGYPAYDAELVIFDKPIVFGRDEPRDAIPYIEIMWRKRATRKGWNVGDPIKLKKGMN